MQINVATSFKLVYDKINLPTNRDSYEGSETAVGKLSARRIPPRGGFFCKSIIEDLPKHNSAENDDTKKYSPGLDAPFRELSNGGFGMSVAISGKLMFYAVIPDVQSSCIYIYMCEHVHMHAIIYYISVN